MYTCPSTAPCLLEYKDPARAADRLQASHCFALSQTALGGACSLCAWLEELAGSTGLTACKNQDNATLSTLQSDLVQDIDRCQTFMVCLHEYSLTC